MKTLEDRVSEWTDLHDNPLDQPIDDRIDQLTNSELLRRISWALEDIVRDLNQGEQP